MKINKSELGKIVKEELQLKNYKLNNKQSEEISATVLETIIKLALQGDEVYIHGVGYIRLKTKKGRIGRHPQTNEKLVIEDKQVLTLDISRSFKQKINE